jgi:hypothetical protein
MLEILETFLFSRIKKKRKKVSGSNYLDRAVARLLFTSAIPLLFDAGTSVCYVSTSWTILFPEHARSQVKGGHSSGEIELIHVEFPT